MLWTISASDFFYLHVSFISYISYSLSFSKHMLYNRSGSIHVCDVALGSRNPDSQIRFTTICPHEVRDERQLTLPIITLYVVAKNRHPRLEQYSARERAVPREAHPNQRVPVQFDLLERRAVREAHGAQVGDVCVVDGLGAVDEGPARDRRAVPVVEVERVGAQPPCPEGEFDDDDDRRFGLDP